MGATANQGTPGLPAATSTRKGQETCMFQRDPGPADTLIPEVKAASFQAAFSNEPLTFNFGRTPATDGISTPWLGQCPSGQVACPGCTGAQTPGPRFPHVIITGKRSESLKASRSQPNPGRRNRGEKRVPAPQLLSLD